MPAENLPRRRKAKLVLMTLFASAALCILLGELMVGWVAPQRTMYPRREFSVDYGFWNFRDRETVHEVRGEWRFVYTTNEYRNRGVPVPISNRYLKPNIVVLGDSNTFGVGVNDGEEYPAVLAQLISEHFNVTNLGVGGWGLTQQIRRYYEFGQLYEPQIVILQYGQNDLRDNLNNQVTLIDESRFKFVESASGINWVKKYLSDSVVQKSQLYNLVRDAAYTLLVSRHLDAVREEISGVAEASDAASVEEKLYSNLLEVFVRDLQKDGVRFLMISVTPIESEYLNGTIAGLEGEGALQFLDIEEVLSDFDDFSSPEGHRWGAKAHHAIGSALAREVQIGKLDK